MADEAGGATDDWPRLYELARERVPEIYKALVRLDHGVRARVVAGAGLDDQEMVAHMRDHDILTAALRIIEAQLSVK